jgi:hypothetical protein
MSKPVSSSSSEPEPFVTINQAIEIFGMFPEKMDQIRFKEILDLRDVLHMRNNLAGRVIEATGPEVGAQLLALTTKTIRSLETHSNRFFEQYVNIANESEVIRTTIPLFTDQVKAYANGELALGMKPTWLHTYDPDALPKLNEKQSLSLTASIYASLEN